MIDNHVAFNLEHALAVARLAAERAGEAILRHFGSGLAVDLKADDSPVTLADREAERLIRETLQASFPEHAIYGEEEGHTGDSEYLWLVDPLDGTKSFIRGNPVFAVLIALSIRGEIVLGVAHAPAFCETSWAALGLGAYLNGRPIRVASTPSLQQCALSTGNLKSLARSSSWTRFGSLVGELNRLRGYGDFLHYHMLASGRIDAVVESDVNILDIAPFVILVREAGGTFTDLSGRPINLATRSVLATGDQGLHNNLHERLAYSEP